MLIECVLLLATMCGTAKERVTYALSVVQNSHIQKIYVVSSEGWRKLNVGKENAFSYQDGRVFVSAEFVLSTKTSLLERVLRHENGHLICQCADEQVADWRGGN